ncbi:MAG: signal peptidase I [Eubacteriales bacterium]|nr:signal peptidase I [Eubacteriales bacterium]
MVLFAGIGWLLFTKVMLFTQVKGNEMFPAMKDGDLLIAFRLQQEYVKNDVVVYTVNGEQKTGRVMGRATDVIMMDDSGSLLVNGTVQTGEILYPTYAKEGIEYPYIVPEESVFILSDYRTRGIDSRDYDAIPLKDVKGKVITILRRRGL